MSEDRPGAPLEDPGQAGEPGGGAGGQEAQEEALRAAYEDQLRRITATELLLQAAASLLNLGAGKIGLGADASEDRDLDQVRDAIDGVRALMPVIERRTPASHLAPLRDALSHLQVAYAREVQGGGQEARPGGDAEGAAPPAADAQGVSPEGAQPDGATPESPDAREPEPSSEQPGEQRRPGPAESSGRLWVPGKG